MVIWAAIEARKAHSNKGLVRLVALNLVLGIGF